jgi:hypothetical protein
VWPSRLPDAKHLIAAKRRRVLALILAAVRSTLGPSATGSAAALLLANAILWLVVAMGWGAAQLIPTTVREGE